MHHPNSGTLNRGPDPHIIRTHWSRFSKLFIPKSSFAYFFLERKKTHQIKFSNLREKLQHADSVLASHCVSIVICVPPSFRNKTWPFGVNGFESLAQCFDDIFIYSSVIRWSSGVCCLKGPPAVKALIRNRKPGRCERDESLSPSL